MPIQEFDDMPIQAFDDVQWHVQMDTSAALERELQSRNTLIVSLTTPLLEGRDGNALPAASTVSEEFLNLDVRGFCKDFNRVKDNLDKSKRLLNRIADDKNAQYAAARDALHCISKIDMDMEDANTITQIINANTERYMKALNEPDVREKFNHWSEMFSRATPILKTIRDELFPRPVPGIDDDNDMTNACPVCFTKEINMAVLPCGHTYCQECCMKMSNSCFVCSATLLNRTRIYL